jgi:CHAT domain-containing protein
MPSIPSHYFWRNVLALGLLLLTSLPLTGVAQDSTTDPLEQLASLQAQVEQLYQEGNLEQALSISTEMLFLAQDTLAPDDPGLVELTLGFQAQLLVEVGYLEEANQLYQETLGSLQEVLGPDDPLTLTTLDKYADFLEDVGEFTYAQELRSESHQRSIRSLGEPAPQTLTRLRALAFNLETQQQLEAASSHLQTVLQGLEVALGSQHPETLSTLSAIARVQQLQGQLQKSLDSLKKLRTLQTEALGAEDYETLSTVEALAETHRQLGQYETAEALFTKVLAQVNLGLGQEDSLTIQTTSHLAQLYEDTGRLKQALELHGQVYELDRKLLGDAHPNIATDLNNLASVNQRLGSYALAEQQFRSALQIMEDALGDDGSYAANIINLQNNLAQLLESQGLYDQAEPLFKQAFSNAQTKLGPEHPSTLALLNNLAFLYESQGDFERSELNYKTVIQLNRKVYGESHTHTLANLNNLGYLYLRDNRPQEALPLFTEVSQAWELQLGKTHQNTMKALNNLGRVHMQLEDYKQAEPLLTEALRRRTKVFTKRHPDTLRSMNDLGVLLGRMGKREEAVEQLQNTLALAEEVLGTSHPYTFETLNNLADFLEELEEFGSAHALRREGFARRNIFFDRVLWVAGDNTRQSYIGMHRPEQDAYLRLLLKQGEQGEDIALEVLNVSLQRKGLLLKITSETQQVVQMSNDPVLKTITTKLTETRKELASLTLAGPTPENRNVFASKIHTFEERVNALQLQLGQASQRFRESLKPVAPEEVVEQLANAALVDFLVYRNEDDTLQLLAVVVSDGELNIVNYGELEPIRELIEVVRETIQDEGSEDEDVMMAANELWVPLWEPLNEYLGEQESIYVAPDSVLNILPFDVLVDDEEEYLIQKYDLRLISSSRDLVAEQLPSAEGDIVIIAGPDYDSDEIINSPKAKEVSRKRSSSVAQGARMGSGLRGLRFDPLPGAEKEGEVIKKVMDEKALTTVIYARRDGEEQRLRTLSKPPNILHIATHGFFLKEEETLAKRIKGLSRGSANRLPPPADNPLLRAGLAFAGLNANAPLLGEIDTDNDGVLTAMEILSLDLTGTQLVVLSACETGLGEIHEGEGVYGLRRSFQEAGVNSVINSFWEVSDDGTQLLMSKFYDKYLSGTPPRQALREARLEMVESMRWSAPFYWSAFVMVGRSS